GDGRGRPRVHGDLGRGLRRAGTQRARTPDLGSTRVRRPLPATDRRSRAAPLAPRGGTRDGRAVCVARDPRARIPAAAALAAFVRDGTFGVARLERESMTDSTTFDLQRDLDQLCVDTIRTLSMDAVQRAASGPPGTPMAMAPVVYALWQHRLRFDPDDPIWPNRDRFVLSAGHASMLLYSLLHLAGVKAVDPRYEVLGSPSVTLDDIR